MTARDFNREQAFAAISLAASLRLILRDYSGDIPAQLVALSKIALDHYDESRQAETEAVAKMKARSSGWPYDNPTPTQGMPR